jgi:hypothetical protein
MPPARHVDAAGDRARPGYCWLERLAAQMLSETGATAPPLLIDRVTAEYS